MAFFKVIQNNEVVDVGYSFLTWVAKYHRFMLCDMDDAEVVLGLIHQDRYYHANWFKEIDSSLCEPAIVRTIELDEFNELKLLLEDEQQIIDILPDEPEPEPEPEPDPEPAEDKPMSIQDMRDKIAELSQFLNEEISFAAETLYPIDTYFMRGITMYKATNTIASGETVVVGQNCVKVPFSDILNELNQ